MPRQWNKLDSRKVASLKEPGRYGDGLGLELQISQWGTKSWLFRYMRDGKTRYFGLGPLHTVSLAEARIRAREARQLLLDGKDPIELKREERDSRRAQANERMLFKDAVDRFLAVHEATWKNDKHKQQYRNTLRDYAYPRLGTRPVSAIDGAAITDALAGIWQSKPVTAARVKQRIERVCQWVKDAMPLPVQPDSKRVRHFPAMPFAELPAFMAELRQRSGVSARALEFTVLSVARTSDTIGAKWKEIDLEAGLWTVSDGRHKTGKDFEIPLSKRAIEILQTLPRERDGYVFPGARAKATLGEGVMLDLLQGMRGKGVSVHGFRSSFRDWAGDQTNFAREVIEAAMSHQIKNRAEAAYRRSDALGNRRRLMEAWSRYCDSPIVEAAVTPLRRGA
jgi:integrase